MQTRHQSQMDRIERKLDALLYMERSMAGEMDKLKKAVADQSTVASSVATLLGELNERLKKAIEDDDPAAIEALSADIEKNTRALSDAVSANTPSANQGRGGQGQQPATQDPGAASGQANAPADGAQPQTDQPADGAQPASGVVVDPENPQQ